MEEDKTIIDKMKKFIGMKIINVGIDFIQLDDGRKIYITKKEVKYITS